MISSRQPAIDTAQQNLVSYCDSQIQATARVRLDCLTFPDDIPQRIDDGRNALRLQQIMSIQGCLRLNPQYRVKVHVDAADWEQRLTLRTQAEHLPELYVPLDYQLIGHNNYSIITAAKTLLTNPHRWWVVDIYLSSDSDAVKVVQQEAIRTFRERCSNDGPPADGLVYYRIRYYQGFIGGYRNEIAEKDAWALLLHRPRTRKADYLTQLLKHGSFPQAFDALMAIPGLAADLSIGNMHSMIALRCDERILCYLQYVRETWAFLAGGDEGQMALVDAKTVHALQSRAPAISKKDMKKLSVAMERFEIFPSIPAGETRQKIWDRLKGIASPIPTLHTFFRDLRYLAVARDVMKELYEPPKHIKMTVDACVATCLSPSANIANDRQKLAQGLWELWRFSMQYGFEMTSHHRLKPRGRAQAGKKAANKTPLSGEVPASSVLWSHFAELARQAGFYSEQITALQPELASLPTLYVPEVAEIPVHRRCGKPYISSALGDHWALSREVLLSQLPRHAVTTAVVRQSIFSAFCRDLQESIQVQTSALNSQPLASSTAHVATADSEISDVALSQAGQDSDVLNIERGAPPMYGNVLSFSSPNETPREPYRLDIYAQDGSFGSSLPLSRNTEEFQATLDRLHDEGYVFSVGPGRGIHKDQCYSAVTLQPSLVLRAGFSTHIGPEYAPGGELSRLGSSFKAYGKAKERQGGHPASGSLHQILSGKVEKVPRSQSTGHHRDSELQAYQMLVTDPELQSGSVPTLLEMIRNLREK